MQSDAFLYIILKLLVQDFLLEGGDVFFIRIGRHSRQDWIQDAPGFG
jgi:hypothetical protein